MNGHIGVGELVTWMYGKTQMAGVVASFIRINGVPCALIDPLQSTFKLTKPVRDLSPFMASKETGGQS